MQLVDMEGLNPVLLSVRVRPLAPNKMRRENEKRGSLKGVMKNERYRNLNRNWRRTRAKMQNFICALCGRKMEDGDITLDHIEPLSKGGVNEFENTQATHKFCNQFKSGTSGYKPK